MFGQNVANLHNAPADLQEARINVVETHGRATT